MYKIIIAIAIFILLGFFAKQSSDENQLYQKNLESAAQFLHHNSNKEGVKVTPSGLQYQVLKTGTGYRHPKADDFVRVHYQGTFIDGKVFDSSIERGEPVSFGLHQVIQGWTEGIQLMVVGEKMRFFIPSKLAYKNQKLGIIKPGSVLIFDVELLAIN